LVFRFHFPFGNPALSSSFGGASGRLRQIVDEVKKYKNSAAAGGVGVTLEEFGQILKVRRRRRRSESDKEKKLGLGACRVKDTSN
jgi:hypothetical protein